MKKLLYFGAFVAAALSFSACQREKDFIENNSKEQVTFTFTAEKAGETRTAAVEGDESVSYKWTNEDLANLHLYLITTALDENNKEKEVQTEVEEISINKESDTRLTITATVDQASSYTFRAMLFAEKTDGGSPKVKTSQTPNGLTNYDPNADILVSEDLTTDTPSNLLLSFERKVVINKMTVKGLTAGEKVDKVVISSNKNITGYYSNGSMSGQFKSISLIYSKEVIPASGEFPVYFVTMPGEGHTLSVSVYTDAAVYSKTFGNNAINFTKGSFTRFGVKSLSREEKTDLSGTYVLTDEAGANIALPYVEGANNITSDPASLEDGVVYYNPDNVDIDKAKVTLAAVTIGEKELYTIAQNGKYLYAAGTVGSDGKNQNYLKATATIPETGNDGYYWEVTYADGAWSIVANRTSTSYSNTMQMNTSNKTFACYGTASQTAVALYADFAPTPVISAGNVALVDGNAITNATDIGASFNNNTATVTAVAYDDETLNTSSTWLSVSVTGTTVKYTATANNTGSERVAYVKIQASNTDGRTVSQTISVTQPVAGATAKTDHLTYALIGVTGTSYSAWSGKTSVSDAVYAGKTAGGNNSIQINNTSGNGIYSSTSGGYLKRVSITWNSNNTNTSRKVTVYANNSAYTSPASNGTKIVDFAVGSSTTSYDFTDNYQYISIVANGAVYLDEIAITWDANPFLETVAKPSISVSNNAVTITCATEGASIYYTTDNTTPTASSSLYTSPISLSEGDSYTIKAIAVKENYNDSEVATKAVSYVAPSNNYYVLLPTDVPEVSAYSTTEKSVTAEDKSVWKLKGYGASETQIQLGKGGDNYILTPACGSAISSISVDCTSIYYLTVQNTDGEELIAAQPDNGVITFDLSSYSYTQVKLVARRSSGTSNAAVYITKIQVNF